MQNEKMKAVILEANQDLRVKNILRQTVTSTSCLIKIINVGVCSSDINRAFGKGAYDYPLIMGHEISGEVIECGKDIKKFNKNSRVVVFPLLPCFQCELCKISKFQQCKNYSYYGSRQDGGYAEYLRVEEWNMLHIPDNVSFKDAATVEPLSVVIHALQRLKIYKVNKKFKLLIIGAGFLGLLMAQVLKKLSPLIEITIIDRNNFKLNIAKNYADHTVCLENNLEWEDFLSSHKDTYNIVVEATGEPRSFRYTIDLVIASGIVLWMGNIYGDLVLPDKLVSRVLRKELQILGTWNSYYNPNEHNDWLEALQLLQDGIHPSNLVSQWITLDELPNTLDKLYQHKQKVQLFESIKVMVNVNFA